MEVYLGYMLLHCCSDGPVDMISHDKVVVPAEKRMSYADEDLNEDKSFK